MAIICITSHDYSVYPSVGLEQIVSMAKLDSPASHDTSDSGDGVYEAHTVAASYGIIFMMSNGTSITWKFASSATRDNVYENIADLALPVTAFENVIATT